MRPSSLSDLNHVMVGLGAGLAQRGRDRWKRSPTGHGRGVVVWTL